MFVQVATRTSKWQNWNVISKYCSSLNGDVLSIYTYRYFFFQALSWVNNFFWEDFKIMGRLVGSCYVFLYLFSRLSKLLVGLWLRTWVKILPKWLHSEGDDFSDLYRPCQLSEQKTRVGWRKNSEYRTYQLNS